MVAGVLFGNDARKKVEKVRGGGGETVGENVDTVGSDRLVVSSQVKRSLSDCAERRIHILHAKEQEKSPKVNG